ncbi:hypothetical protein [Rhizobium miluonense]|uniref:Uncharacterized protein n=1 Tax=Rhizobium miluonense TaxID=411945 RepID=A0A1C3XE97_9HYPH|nr:hypothetical protein [Rhizobium miluonense]SCB50539.1 hypothetical protein GA0061102_10922 [Rhizobium miluonense]
MGDHTIVLTIVGGQQIEVDATKVVQVRPRTPAEKDFSNTRVDWAAVDYVVEEPEAVVDLVNGVRVAAGGKQLAQLKTANSLPIWFAGEKATGPWHLLAPELRDGVNSAYKIGNTVVPVGSTSEEVRAVIIAAGGTPLTIRDDAPFAKDFPTK